MSAGSTQATMTEVEAWFAAQGLAVPYVPERFAGHLAKRHDGFWATNDLSDPYDAAILFLDALAHQEPPSLALGAGGYGAANRTVNYHVLDEHLAVFVQRLWNTAYGENDADDVAARFRAAGELVRRLDAARDAGDCQPGTRFAVLDTQTGGGMWATLRGPLDRDELLRSDWAESEDPLGEALAALS